MKTLIGLGKMTWDGQCDFCAAKMCAGTKSFPIVGFSCLRLPCAHLRCVCLNTSKAVKHAGVLCHEKSFANLG